MELYFAPLEGITGPQFRRAHHKYFSGVDKYYLPFISPTRDHVFTAREIRNVGLEANQGMVVVPQLLTKSAADFIWCARALGEMGHREVDLNLGCPSGTVVAKGKGAGMLADPQALDRFLGEIYAADLGNVQVTLKTRLGLHDPAEFKALAEVFNKYPVPLLIVHPRVREDFYKVPVRGEEFLRYLPQLERPVCYNGGIVSQEGVFQVERRLPQLAGAMIGRGLVADPALAQKARGGPAADLPTLRAFHDELYHSYLRDFSGERSTIFHMKELWSYFGRLFDGGEKLFKQIRKAQDCRSYDPAVEAIFRDLPLRQKADWSGPAKI